MTGHILTPCYAACITVLWLPYTNNHKLGSLKQQNVFSHSSGGQMVNMSFTGLKSSCQQGPCSLGRLLGKFLASFSFWGCWHSFACDCITPISASIFTWPLALWCISSLPSASLLKGYLWLNLRPNL